MILLFWLAQAAQTITVEPPMVPQSPGWWLVWIVRNWIPAAALGAVLWRIAVRPIHDRIKAIDDPKSGTLAITANGLGTRIDVLKEASDRHETRTADQGVLLRDLVTQVGNMREAFGETRRAIKELTDLARENANTTHGMLGNVRIDIARSEEQLKTLGNIKDIIREVFLQGRRPDTRDG